MKPKEYPSSYLISLIQNGMTDEEIVNLLNLKGPVKQRYQKRLINYRAGKTPAKQSKEMGQLCWTCHTKGCKWMFDNIPISGWTATKTDTCGGSYRITECPNYKETKCEQYYHYQFEKEVKQFCVQEFDNMEII